jgi:hypothetical protein
MSYDALMRWEWEGGTPAPVSEPREATPAEPVRNALTRPRPTNGRQRARQVATVSRLPSEGWRGDGSER